MQLDDKICYCYGVSLRKLVKFARRTRPHRPSQMSGCLGAGTGCGWCIPILTRVAEDPDQYAGPDVDPEAYAAARKGYIDTHQPRNEFTPKR